jgi:methionine-rich copper-binding protein CopC
VLLYSEVENFTSRRSSNDGFRTILQSAIELYQANDLQQPVATIPLASDTTEDFCRAQRRDYFHSYEFSIPPNLEPGQYTLVLRVVDQQSRKVATSKVNFEVE